MISKFGKGLHQCYADGRKIYSYPKKWYRNTKCPLLLDLEVSAQLFSRDMEELQLVYYKTASSFCLLNLPSLLVSSLFPATGFPTGSTRPPARSFLSLCYAQCNTCKLRICGASAHIS